MKLPVLELRDRAHFFHKLWKIREFGSRQIGKCAIQDLNLEPAD